MLTKKDLEHLADLARIELALKEDEKLQKDLGSILGHFNELNAVNTNAVAPMTGGTTRTNVLRDDVRGGTDDTGKGPEAFPEAQDGYLKVPPIF